MGTTSRHHPHGWRRPRAARTDAAVCRPVPHSPPRRPSRSGAARHLRSVAVAHRGSLAVLRLLPHTVLDIVVEDKVQLLIREAILPRQHAIDLVKNGLGSGAIEL